MLLPFFALLPNRAALLFLFLMLEEIRYWLASQVVQHISPRLSLDAVYRNIFH